MTETILSRNSKTIAALTFCLVTAATQMLERLMWKKLVRAMLVTGERTCCRAWMTFTRNASTAFRLLCDRYLEPFVNYILSMHFIFKSTISHILVIYSTSNSDFRILENLLIMKFILIPYPSHWNKIYEIYVFSMQKCVLGVLNVTCLPNVISVDAGDEDLPLVVIYEQSSNHDAHWPDSS